MYPFHTKHPPTDHHLMEPWCHVDYDVDKLYFRPISRCIGGRHAHSPLMEYERAFLANYRRVPRLSWSVYLEGHEPSFRAMGTLDQDLANHLIAIRKEHGENTAVLLLSDHGIHYGRFFDGSPSGLTSACAVLIAEVPTYLLGCTKLFPSLWHVHANIHLSASTRVCCSRCSLLLSFAVLPVAHSRPLSPTLFGMLHLLHASC